MISKWMNKLHPLMQMNQVGLINGLHRSRNSQCKVNKSQSGKFYHMGQFCNVSKGKDWSKVSEVFIKPQFILKPLSHDH